MPLRARGRYCTTLPAANQPPFEPTPEIIPLVAEVAGAVPTWKAAQQAGADRMRLRREQRVRSIQASLEIEANSLTLEQVTAILSGKKISGPAREIREVENAAAAYDRMGQWDSSSAADLCAAHATLMADLHDEAGRFRSGGVGIYRLSLIHI